MIRYLILFFGLLVAQNDKMNSLVEHLKPLENYIGKTFKGEFSNSTPENPVFDVQHWERILNGQGIRITHSVNNGEYGGESIIMWDKELKSLKSWYYTTAGFYTQATVEIEEGKFSSIEEVTGNENGITKVKAIVQLLSDGMLHTKSQYFQNGKWVDGHEVHYKEDPNAKVILK